MFFKVFKYSLNSLTNESLGTIFFIRWSVEVFSRRKNPFSHASLIINADFGLGKGLQSQPYPIFKNYYSGGLGSVRGFEQGTLGPRDISGIVVGGPKKVTINSEFLMPFPGAGNDKTLRLYGFYDMGNVFGEYDTIKVSQFRTSLGAGLSWVSPMGPLRFAWAKPVRSFTGDRIQRLQFQIGTSFWWKSF